MTLIPFRCLSSNPAFDVFAFLTGAQDDFAARNGFIQVTNFNRDFVCEQKTLIQVINFNLVLHYYFSLIKVKFCCIVAV